LVSVLLKNGADVNAKISYYGDENKVSPLDFAAEAYLAYPLPEAFEAIQMLAEKNARYGDGWRVSCFDVGPPNGTRAQGGCLAGAAARVFAFAQCVEKHVPDIWDSVEREPGVRFLANALNGFSMPYVHADLREMRLAMRAWCGPLTRKGSVADVVLMLQESPAALAMTLKSVDPQESGTCGNNAAYQAFVALNAVPFYVALARAPAEFENLGHAVLAARSIAAAHLIAGRVHERIAQFEREMGQAQTPVTLGVQVEYLHRVAAAVGVLLPEQLASQLNAVLPDESLVPSGHHVHRACAGPDHDSFINCLAVDCAGVLRGERTDLVIDALASAGGVRAVWRECLLECVDRMWDSLQLAVPGESRHDMFQKTARGRTLGGEKISDDLMSPIADIKDAEFNEICKRVQLQYDTVDATFCNCLTTTIVKNPPSFLGEAGVTRSAIASALRGRSIHKVTAIPMLSMSDLSISNLGGRMPLKSASRRPFR